MLMNETSLSHDGGTNYWEVTASERWSVTKLRKLAAEHPDKVVIYHENEDGSILVKLPKEFVKFSAPKRLNLSDEQIAELREKAKIRFKNQRITPCNSTQESIPEVE